MNWKLFAALLLVSLACRAAADSSEEDVSVDLDEAVPEPTAADDLVYESPVVDLEKFHFVDNFDDPEASKKLWILSSAKKDDASEDIAKYDGEWKHEYPQRIVWKNDLGLVLKSKAKHAAISAPLRKPFTFEDKPLVVQYEVNLQNGQECGGSYLKLLSASPNGNQLETFNDKTPYTIMFGPDKCGNDVKLHFIFRHVNPINGSISEKHCRKPKDRIDEAFKDKLPHLYQLVINPDNTFTVSIDHKVVIDGSLLTDFTPAVNPPKEIDDPTDFKPSDWDEREKIPDPNVEKPEDWNEDAPPQIPDPSATKPQGWLDSEPEMIPDTSAVKPQDWDEEIDGEWEAPLVDNPLCEKAVGCGEWRAPLVTNSGYKGKWRAPLIDNPNYQGKWAAKKIPNPDFFEDMTPFKMTPIAAVGIELWSISNDILFDNIVITDDVEVARDYAARTFDLKRKFIESESESFVNKLLRLSNDNPWLWGVYIVVLGTPLSFAVYTLCCSNKESREKESQHKKDDSVTPDDDDVAPELVPEEKVESSKPKKKDLDVPITSEPVPVEEQDSKSDEDTNEEVTPEEKEHSNSPTTEGARKRKPRKE